MPDNQSNNKSTQPKVIKKSTISVIWIIPIATLILSLFLGFRAWQQQGTEITIIFQQASGITANKTRIRYRDVDIGLVKQVNFDNDLTSVVVKAELDSNIASFLSENSSFWIVSPQISLTGVSGLSTLLSGVYIELDPGEKGKSSLEFVALNEPPIVRSYTKGTSYTLESKNLKSLTVGSRIFYRKIPVGEVVSYRFTEDAQKVQVRIFVEAPYDQFVYKDSNFWNASGVSINLNSRGISARIESVSSLLWGGISFDTPQFPEKSNHAEAESVFPLFPDRESVVAGNYSIEYPYKLRFSGSVRGLNIDAPVEMKGIEVGRVTDIQLVDENIHVGIVIQPERLNADNVPNLEQLNSLLNRLVSQQGMRAQLKTGSLITGSLFIDLALDASKAPSELVLNNGMIEIPTMNNQFEQLSKIASNVMERLDQVAIDEIGDDIAGMVKSVRKTVESLEQESFGEQTGELFNKLNSASSHLEALLVDAQNALKQADSSLEIIEPDSILFETLLEMLRDVSEAAESIELLTDELGRNPQSLIYGNKNPEE